MAKRQTHYLEVVAPARACRFNSCPAHQLEDVIVFGTSLMIDAWRGCVNLGISILEDADKEENKKDR